MTEARQREAVRRASAAADSAEAAVRRVWLAVLRAVKDGHPHQVALLTRGLPAVVRAAVGDALAAQALWAHRSARAVIISQVPRNLLRRAAYERAGHGQQVHPRFGRGSPARDAGEVLRERRRAGRGVLRSVQAVRESIFLADLLAPLREPAPEPSDADISAVLFPAPSRERIEEIIYASGWEERIRSGTGLAAPDALAARVATGLALGKSHQEIARDILPAVQGVQSSARRIARTESMRVATEVQLDAHAGLGDLVVGYRIHATLDANTRPEHRARHGTVYYAEPGPNQLGYDSMPRPPMEADGTMSWNCRCWLSPVLRE